MNRYIMNRYHVIQSSMCYEHIVWPRWSSGGRSGKDEGGAGAWREEDLAEHEVAHGDARQAAEGVEAEVTQHERASVCCIHRLYALQAGGGGSG